VEANVTTATQALKSTDDRLAKLRERFPEWRIWLSDVGRCWATRLGNIPLARDRDPDWAMTIDADTLPQLAETIAFQNSLNLGVNRAESAESGSTAGIPPLSRSRREKCAV
jgi:hypothetical protein